MFYHIIIRTAGGRSGDLTLGYYHTLCAAKEALMDWARGVLALNPDKKYREVPVDGRAAEKQVLRVEIAAAGEKAAYEGFIVEREFADKSEQGYNSRMHDICTDARDTTCGVLALGEAVEIPFDKEDEDGENTTVRFWGRHYVVNADVKCVKKDNKGKVVIEAYSENGIDESLAPDDILLEEWPYLADVVLEQKRKQETKKA